jgi:hypothetical protein
MQFDYTPEEKKRTILIVSLIGAIIVVGLVLVGVVGYIFDTQSGGKSSSTSTPSAPQTKAERITAEFHKIGVYAQGSSSEFDLADAVCRDSAAGSYPYSIARSIASQNYELSDDQTEEIVEISIRILCPKFIDRIR